MKLKYIIPSFVAALMMFVSCDDNNDPTYLDEVRVSSSYVTIDLNGGSTDITVTASDSWSIDASEIPSWLTVSPTSGSAGESKVTFSAAKGLYGQTAELHLTCAGRTQNINVMQGVPVAADATCADVIAGPDSKQYRVTGTCTAIANTTYGNWYLEDATGQIYIYGTLDKDGKTKNFLSLGLEVGDVVTVEGPKTTYGSTVELVDVTVVKIQKSLLKVLSESVNLTKNGGELEVTVAYKGSGAYAVVGDEYKDWIKYKETVYKPGVATLFETSPADTAVVKFDIAANEAGGRTGVIGFKSSNSSNASSVSYSFTQEGAIIAATVAEFNAAAVGTTQYRMTGVITELYASDKQGKSFYIQDYSGKTLVYRAEGFIEAGAKVGDVVTVVGQRGAYKDSPQMVSGTFEELKYAVTEVSISDFLSKPDAADVYYKVTGTISSVANATYGNLYITDGSNQLYVYGCYPGYGATGDNRKNFLSTAGIEVGDKLTMIGYKATYNGTIELCGGIYFSHEKAQ